MNAASLVARVQRRVPGYDVSEYLDECNACYKECWDYITQLEDSYFTDRKIVTVNTQATEFDFLYNSNGNLSSAVSPRYFEISMLQVNQPGDSNWIPANPRNWNDPSVLAEEQNSQQPVAQSPPYLFTQFSKASFSFARPLPVGTQFRVTYTMRFMDLVLLSNGTVTSSGTNVTGTGTNFLQILPPDFQAGSLPGVDQDTAVGLELVLAGQSQTYQVATVTNDTTLTTRLACNPAITSGSYQLASVPDIPEAHHNVISTLATRNFMSTPGNDPRFTEWAALAEKELDAMRDSVMIRQKLEPPRRGRFPFSLTRNNSYPTVSR